TRSVRAKQAHLAFGAIELLVGLRLQYFVLRRGTGIGLPGGGGQWLGLRCALGTRHESQVCISPAFDCNAVADAHARFVGNNRGRRSAYEDGVLEGLLGACKLAHLLPRHTAANGAQRLVAARLAAPRSKTDNPTHERASRLRRRILDLDGLDCGDLAVADSSACRQGKTWDERCAHTDRP